VGYNRIKTSEYISYNNSTYLNPCDRCRFSGYVDKNYIYLPIPLRVGYITKLISYDITFSTASLYKDNRSNYYRSFSEVQTNIGFGILKRMGKNPVLTLGVIHSYLNSAKKKTGDNNYIGPSVTFGVQKLQFRGSLGWLIENEFNLFSNNKHNISTSYLSLDLMYYIYPFRKREKKVE
jgi:hypothetical protein